MTSPKGRKEHSVPESMRELYTVLIKLTDGCCRESLNDEYAELCRRMVATLCRKRPSPLLGGSLNVWAAAVVHTIGSVNFLFDKTQTPHMTGGDIADGFGVAKSSVASKAAHIRNLLRIRPFDPKWCLPSRLVDNPMAWMIEVNGFLMDARYAPRPIQEEAHRRGLIPYLPDAEAP